MSYTPQQELNALQDILVIAENDLNTLLYSDHPPPDHLDKIYYEQKLISELNDIILDLQSKIIFNNLKH